MEEYNYRRESNVAATKNKSFAFYSTLLFIIGILLIALGFIVMILDHLQTAFPIFDSMYERYNYDDTSFKTAIGKFYYLLILHLLCVIIIKKKINLHLIGPMLIAVGGFVILLSFVLGCYTTISGCSSNN